MTNHTDPSDDATAKVKTALKKAVGSINRTLAILDQCPECAEVLVQLDSAIGLLNSTRTQILEQYIDNCLDQGLPEAQKVVLKRNLLKLYKLNK